MAKRSSPKDVFAVVEVKKCFVPLVRGKAHDSVKNIAKVVMVKRFAEELERGNGFEEAYDASLKQIVRGTGKLTSMQLRILVCCLVTEVLLKEVRRLIK